MSNPDLHDATAILAAATAGSGAAADLLMPLVYDELRRFAAVALASESPNHTLQPTALVNEAYLRLVDQTRATPSDRAHFFAVAATMIRRVLVDHARTRGRLKRGGDRRRQPLDGLPDDALGRDGMAADYVAIDEALTELAAQSPRAARVVELRYFGGLSIDETAALLDVSTPTVERDWRFARAWLHAALVHDA